MASGDDALPLAPFPPWLDSGPPSEDGPPGQVSYSDGASGIDAAAAYAVTLTTSAFTVPPGGEVYKCQDFANPFGGGAADIVRYDLDMSPGSHHMLLFYSPGATDGPIIDCPQGGLQIGPYTFGAQSPKATEQFPAGIGAAIPAGTGFTVNAHYVNTTAVALDAVVKVTMYVAPPGVVTRHAGVLQFILTSLSIPPTGQPATVSGSCPVSQAMNLLWANSHMHQRATHFVATSGGVLLEQTDQWSEPPAQAFTPPFALASGATVDWSCTYVNDTGSTLTFGESALTNAMCNFGAVFYPLEDISNPVIRCLQ